MRETEEIGEIVRRFLADGNGARIIYSRRDGTIEVNGQVHRVGKLSFADVESEILRVLEELYGEYYTTPIGFNSEVYHNSGFRAQVLALGSEGLLIFSIETKRRW